MTDRCGGRNSRTFVAGSAASIAASHRRMLAHIEYRIWCAERIGWPALAESFRRDLAALKGRA